MYSFAVLEITYLENWAWSRRIQIKSSIKANAVLNELNNKETILYTLKETKCISDQKPGIQFEKITWDCTHESLTLKHFPECYRFQWPEKHLKNVPIFCGIYKIDVWKWVEIFQVDLSSVSRKSKADFLILCPAFIFREQESILIKTNTITNLKYQVL